MNYPPRIERIRGLQEVLGISMQDARRIAIKDRLQEVLVCADVTEMKAILADLIEYVFE